MNPFILNILKSAKQSVGPEPIVVLGGIMYFRELSGTFYQFNKFYESDVLTVLKNKSADYLFVGSGGAAGTGLGAGGGGGGEVIATDVNASPINLTVGNHNIVVGGITLGSASVGNGANGQDTTAIGQTAKGGGGGGGSNTTNGANGSTGASGGGGNSGYNGGSAGVGGTATAGNPGGNGGTTAGGSDTNIRGGGGGGPGDVGGNGSPSTYGTAGAGVTSSVSGAEKNYSVGGTGGGGTLAANGSANNYVGGGGNAGGHSVYGYKGGDGNRGEVIFKTAATSLSQSTVLSDTLSYNDTGGYNGYTVRVVIPASEMSAPGGAAKKIRLSLAGPASGTTSISGMFIGHSAGTSGNYSFAATPEQVTYLGDSAFVLQAAATLESDLIDFAWDGVSDVVVSFYINASGNMQSRLSGDAGYVFSKAGNEPATVSASGYSGSGSNPTTSAVVSGLTVYY